MSEQGTILLGRATGHQRGTLLWHLVGNGLKLCALTQTPEGEAAQALAGLGIDVVRGDLDELNSLKAARKGVCGVFAVQDTWEADDEREEEQGERIAGLAREAGVPHFVSSSVGSA